MKTLLLLCLILILSIVSFGQSDSQAAANTQTLQKDKAIVYIYATKAPPTIARLKKPIFLNGRKIADIQPARYFIAFVAPDLHNFTGISKDYGGVRMEFEAGKTYYLQLKWIWEGTRYAGGIAPVSNDTGAAAVKELRLIVEKNIKDKGIVVLRLN